MSCGLFLVLNIHGTAEFDVERICALLKDLPGVRNWNESGPDRRFSCEYSYNDDLTDIHILTGDRKCIFVDGMGDASLHVAMEIQRNYGVTIHAVDKDCSCDIPITEVSSLADFADKIEHGWGFDNLLRAAKK